MSTSAEVTSLKDKSSDSKKKAEASTSVAEGRGRSVDDQRASFHSNVFTIARREFRSYFDSVVGYVVLAVGLLGVGLAFFFWPDRGFWQVDRATLGWLFQLLPFVVCIVVPLVTMRALADEKRQGTLELLITMPVRDSEVILGKYLAALAVALLLFAASALYGLALFKWPWNLGAIDWGPVGTGYLGLFLFAAAATALGIMFSGLTDSSVVAFFGTFFTLVVLMALGFLAESVRGPAGETLAFLSLWSRYASFGRGLIDTRDVVFFVSVTVISLLVAFQTLESRKWS